MAFFIAAPSSTTSRLSREETGPGWLPVPANDPSYYQKGLGWTSHSLFMTAKTCFEPGVADLRLPGVASSYQRSLSNSLCSNVYRLIPSVHVGIMAVLMAENLLTPSFWGAGWCDLPFFSCCELGNQSGVDSSNWAENVNVFVPWDGESGRQKGGNWKGVYFSGHCWNSIKTAREPYEIVKNSLGKAFSKLGVRKIIL